jgi:SagB-type dehydrogenase family enzyme
VKVALLCMGLLTLSAAGGSGLEPDMTQTIPLPSPETRSDVSVEQAISRRRSVRSFAGRPVSLGIVGQLLWAAQGVTSPDRGRTAPSAGALYPLEVYLVAGNVGGLDAGVYRYRPEGHRLIPHGPGDVRRTLAQSAVGQAWIADAAAVLVITAVYERTRSKYGQRTERYVHMEVGHAAQNIYLQAESLGVGTVMVGAFRDREVKRVLSLSTREAPLALMPVGHPD